MVHLDYNDQGRLEEGFPIKEVENFLIKPECSGIVEARELLILLQRI